MQRPINLLFPDGPSSVFGSQWKQWDPASGSGRSKLGVNWGWWWQWPLLFLCCVFSSWETSLEIHKPSLSHYAPREWKKVIGSPGLKQTERGTELKWASVWLIESLHFLVLCSIWQGLNCSEVPPFRLFPALFYVGAQAKTKATGGGTGVTENQSSTAESCAFSVQKGLGSAVENTGVCLGSTSFCFRG